MHNKAQAAVLALNLTKCQLYSKYEDENAEVTNSYPEDLVSRTETVVDVVHYYLVSGTVSSFVLFLTRHRSHFEFVFLRGTQQFLQRNQLHLTKILQCICYSRCHALPELCLYHY